jgi:hypothetical protein
MYSVIFILVTIYADFSEGLRITSSEGPDKQIPEEKEDIDIVLFIIFSLMVVYIGSGVRIACRRFRRLNNRQVERPSMQPLMYKSSSSQQLLCKINLVWVWSILSKGTRGMVKCCAFEF